MTKNVATVEATTFGELSAHLSELGYELQCPDTGNALGFNSDGDGPVRLSTSEVATFLVEGSGVSFWRGPTESLYISLVEGKPRIHFDGFTAAEEKTLCDSLLRLGVSFSVAYEG